MTDSVVDLLILLLSLILLVRRLTHFSVIGMSEKIELPLVD